MIIGDVMMDSYIWGKVERVSPEAPVPVVKVSNTENRLGGAANVALNVQSLGAKPFICAIIGEDKAGEEFLSILRNQNLSEQGILKIKDRPTTVKTRIIAHNQQIVRVDAETDENISEAETELIIGGIKKTLAEQKIDAIIFQDYDKGLISENLISQIVKLADAAGIITVVDPKKRNFHSYKGVHLFKPNLKELQDGLKTTIDPLNNGQVEHAIAQLKTHLGVRAVMLTLSEHGVFIRSDLGQRHIPAHKRDIADVSGAGDTVIATAALCLAAGLDEFKASEIANLAGGLVCEHVGVVPVDKARLLREVGEL
jgi:rfaE bifunctional protein kinase chain/domain